MKLFRLGIKKLSISADIKVPSIAYIYETKKSVKISRLNTKANNNTVNTFKEFKTDLKSFKTVSIYGLGLIVGKIFITQKYKNGTYAVEGFADTFNYVDPRYIKVPLKFIQLKDEHIKNINHHASIPF
ncbi:hypothetical protein P5915_00660 [Acholeplasma manati]|nr:hypothetical protein [Paracholeplasma manati]